METDKKNRKGLTTSDVYGGAVPNVGPKKNIILPGGEAEESIKGIEGIIPERQFPLGGRPAIKIRDQLFREVNPRGLRFDPSKKTPAALGINDWRERVYARTLIPDLKTFKIYEVKERFSVNPKTANFSEIKMEYFILMGKMPIYYGHIEEVSLPNNGLAAVTSWPLQHNKSIPLDIWLPQYSKLGIMSRVQANVDLTITDAIDYEIVVNGYLIDQVVPMGTGDSAEYSTPFSASDFNEVRQAYFSL